MRKLPHKRLSIRPWVMPFTLILAGIFTLFFLVLLGLAGEIYDYQDSFDGVHLPKVDAIVCLAGGRGRITAAGDLWYRYFEMANQTSGEKAPVLYFSGLGPQAHWGAVSKQIRRGVLKEMRPQDIVIEKESSNTYNNAKWLAGYAQERGWQRVLLLTSSYHMKRSKFIFNRVFQTFHSPVELETYSVFLDPFSSEDWKSGPNGIRVTLIEYLKWVYYKQIWSHGWPHF